MTPTLLCETVTGPTMAALLAARDAADAGDMVELRLDGVADVDVARALAGRTRPAIVTCRPTWEGGLFAGSEDARRAILRQALEQGAEWVDVEWRAGFDDLIARAPARVIVSSHDFSGVPADLEARLAEADAAGARFKLIVTDGVFSMDGFIAPLRPICDLAEKHDALVMVDDSHAVGFMGRTGRGTPEHCGVADRVDLVSGTLGKALGGASGGYVSGRREIIALLRQRSRPYLFSNTLAPAITAASLAALELITKSTALRDRLEENTRSFRAGLAATGLTLKPGRHPIVPVMLGDAALSQHFAARLLDKGVYAVGFFFPVVPQGEARIRTQVSAAHSPEDLAFAIRAFADVKQELAL